MIKLTIPKLGKADWHTYMRSRFPEGKPRMGGYVFGTGNSGAIVRHTHGRVYVTPTIPSLFGIALCLLGIGVLLWALLWSGPAEEIAGEIVERFERDFGLK